MLIDTHCHLNLMAKKKFETPLTELECSSLAPVIEEAKKNNVTALVTIGTSLIESINCTLIAQRYPNVYATVGIHPHDAGADWYSEFKQLKKLVCEKEKYAIVGIGECGFDFHHPDYHVQRQLDCFRAHIELALEHNLALVIHTRDAYEETWKLLDEYRGQITRGILHCFSQDAAFAQHFVEQGYTLGISATITYPKNELLRDICRTTALERMVLETDAPFLPPQHIRGQQNHPREIGTVAHQLTEIRTESYDAIAQQTTATARHLFGI